MDICHDEIIYSGYLFLKRLVGYIVFIPIEIEEWFSVKIKLNFQQDQLNVIGEGK